MYDIPRTATQKNVNNVVFKHIAPHLINVKKIIDVPCGSGEFLVFLKKKYPHIIMHGADLDAKFIVNRDIEFTNVDIKSFLSLQDKECADLATCISGVMCFDEVSFIINEFHRILRKNGCLVVTNDNIMTMRDRIHFLFFGRFKRFKKTFENNEGIWNILVIQALVMHLREAGFRNIKIEYTAVYIEDYFLIPLVLIFYPIDLCFTLSIKTSLPFKLKYSMFSFKSFLARHYVISALK